MPLVVQKYGGTSVSTEERRQQVIGKIIKAKEAGNDVVVVVSAMGRKGDPYATDTLLEMLKSVPGKTPSDRTKDMIASCGEIISACVLASSIEEHGYAAMPLTGFQAGIRTNDEFTNGLVEQVDSSRIRQILSSGAIAVVAGFQGCNAENDLVTLGRGGSDTTAIALGGAMNAEEVIIYTDVPGIAYTDPRIIPSVPFLKSIDFAPMYILARTGAKVVHYRAIETAIQFNRPFWVRSTFSDDPGTLIGQKGEAPGGLFGISLMKDLVLAHRKKDPCRLLEELAVNEWFYRQHPQRASVILSPDKVWKVPPDCQIKEVSIITLQWDPEAGITPETVATALDSHGIVREAYFPVPQGGAWAVDSARSKEAILALYRAPLHKKITENKEQTTI